MHRQTLALIGEREMFVGSSFGVDALWDEE